MDIQLQGLVCSEDQRTVKVLQVLLSEMSIAMELCGSRADAAHRLHGRNYDGVWVDCALSGATDLLRDVKLSPTSRRAVTFAVLEGMASVKEVFGLGASFILYKPLSIEKTKTSLRAAHGLMMRERRRHFRHALQGVPVALSFPGVPETQGTVLDLSQGGMSVRLMEYVERRGALTARFTLPGQSDSMQVEGEITWADDFGRVGVHFTSVPDAARAALDQWLQDRSREIAVKGATAVEPQRSRSGVAVESITSAAVAAPQVAVAPPPPAAAEPEPGPRLRSEIRAELKIAATVVTLRKGRPAVVEGQCEDFSPDGLGMKARGELAPGEPVLVHVTLPSLEVLRLHADVRHRKGDRIGLEFVGMSNAERDHLRAVCDLLPAAE